MIYIVLWCLIGAIAVWREYHGTLKDWYDRFGESYWDFDKRYKGYSALRLLLVMSPIFVIGGVVSLLLFEVIGRAIALGNPVWYFTTKNKRHGSNAL